MGSALNPCSDRNCLNEGASGIGLIEIFVALPLEVEGKLVSQDQGGAWPEDRCANARQLSGESGYTDPLLPKSVRRRFMDLWLKLAISR